MPWSDSERARHERYALVENEKAIRLAQAEAARVAAREAATSAQQIAQQVARQPVEVAEFEPGDGAVPVGPNEAAFLAARHARPDGDSVTPPRVKSKSGRKIDQNARAAETSVKAAARTRRSAPGEAPRPATPIRVAAAPSLKPGLFGQSKFVYPGDSR